MELQHRRLCGFVSSGCKRCCLRWFRRRQRVRFERCNRHQNLELSNRRQVDSSPAVVNSIVYIGSDDYNVYALNATTGSKIWSFGTGYYVDSCPAVANGVVYIGSEDYNVYALNATSGSKIWSYPTSSQVESSPAVADGVVYVGSDDNNVYALNATTGTQYGLTEPRFCRFLSRSCQRRCLRWLKRLQPVRFWCNYGSSTIPTVPSPTIPEFPNQALAFSLVAIMACAAFAVIAAKKKRINGKILQG